MFTNGIITSRIAGNKKDLLIPKTAVLWTGKRAVVYVKVSGRNQPTFQYREITLGPVAGEFYIVAEGLEEGEEIAVNGVFKIDAAAQLAGKPSMMNPEGGKVATAHDHSKMEMGGESSDMNSQKASQTREMGADKTEKINVYGNCGMCKSRIEKAAKSVEGVSKATWDATENVLTVKYDETRTTVSKIEEAVAKVGHDTDNVKADDKTYNSLPGCCQYERHVSEKKMEMKGHEGHNH